MPLCKDKGFPYSLPSVGPGADYVQAVSPHVTVSHPPGGRLPLLSTRPAVTFPAAEHHRPLADTVTVISRNCSLLSGAIFCLYVHSMFAFFVFSLISIFCVCTFLFGCCYVSLWAAVSAIFSLVVPAICNFLQY